MYHIFFNFSSTDGYFGCFYVLAVVNSAAMNIGVHVSFRIMAFSKYMSSCSSEFEREKMNRTEVVAEAEVPQPSQSRQQR